MLHLHDVQSYFEARKADMKWYPIGEFAAKTGVTPDFVKYHEKNGTLQPKITENGYRYYTAVRVSNVSECLKLKNMGFSGREIRELTSGTDYAQTIELFNSRRTDIECRIRYLQGLLEYTDEMNDTCDAYAAEAWHIRQFEDFYYLMQTRNFLFDDIGDQKILKEWQQWQPVVRATARVDGRKELPPVIDWGVSVPGDFARKQGLTLKDPVEHIPAGRYLEYFDRRAIPYDQNNDDHEEVRNNMFANVNKILEQHNFKLTGPSFFIVQTKLFEDGQRYTYQKIRVPIE